MHQLYYWRLKLYHCEIFFTDFTDKLKTCYDIILNENNKKIKDDKEIGNKWNKYFANIKKLNLEKKKIMESHLNLKKAVEW